MKKALTVLGLGLGVMTSAHAQSSVTLYGLIDAGVSYINNVRTSAAGRPAVGGAEFAQQSGAINGSRWGFRGREDLGDGLAALFVLENGFTVGNGAFSQQGREFGRQAYMGLSSAQFGTVTLGRQYASMADFISPFSLTATGFGGTSAAHPYDNDDLNNVARISNTVKYTSIDYRGFKFGGMYAFSNQAGGFNQNSGYSGGLAYGNGGFSFAAGYMQLDNSSSAGTAVTSAVSGATIGSGRRRVYGAGIGYTIAKLAVNLVVTQSKYDSVTGVPTSILSTIPVGAYVRFNNFELNARYNFTPAWSVAAGYTYTQSRESGFSRAGSLGSDSSPKYQLASLNTDYALSKRTDVYLEGIYGRVSGGSHLGGFGINGIGQSATNTQVMVTAGMRHRF